MISLNETKRLRAFDDEVFNQLFMHMRRHNILNIAKFSCVLITQTHTHTNNDTITHTMLILGKGTILALEGRL